MSSRPLDFAVVVVHHGESTVQTDALLAGLAADPDIPAVILVDNGPGHHGWGAVPVQVTILRADENLGYGGGANVGVDHAIGAGHADVVVMATDAVVQPGDLAGLVASGRAAGAAVTGPRITYEGGRTIWADGIELDPTWSIARNRHKGRALAATPAPDRAPLLTGHVLVLHDVATRPWLRFDDRYFMYYEDVDLCERAAAHGGLVHLDATTVIQHRKPGDASYRFGPTQQFHMSRSGLIHLRTQRRRRPSRLVGFLALTVYRSLRADGPRAALAAWQGLLAGWRAAPT